MNLTLPTAKDLADRVTWNGLSIKELVDAGRLSPVDAAEQSIILIQQEAIYAGELPPLSEIENVALAYEELEQELLDLLLNV